MRLHHRVDGPDEAPVLVLSNSLGTDLDLWSANLPAFAQSFRVVRYDQRGHGRSGLPSDPFGFGELGEDVVRLLDDLGVERASFCGISMGGATGLWLAVNAPHRLDRLVVACSAAKFGEPEGWHERARVVREQGMAAIADAVVDRWFTPRLRADAPAVVARFRERLLASPVAGYAACCEALAGWDYRERVAEISVPTLVLAGADDPATPPEQGAFVADLVPDARLVVIPAAAHLANVEQPGAFSEAVLSHLALSEAA